MSNENNLGGTISIGGDFEVPRMGYGSMRLTGAGIWGDFPDHEAGIAVLKHTRELGIRFIDTADAYGPETSETLIADALHPFPKDTLIATKGGLTRSGPNQWEPNGHPQYLREACEGSLKRLGVDQIDLYQMHRPDPAVPYEDSIGTLSDLQAEGKVRHVGVSNVNMDQLRTAQAIVDVVSVQNRYNLTDRSSEAVLKACEGQGIAFLPWAPVAAGQLAQPGGLLDEIAKALGATQSQVSIAWLLAHSPVMVPIPGTSSIEHLNENTAAAALELSADQIAELDNAG